MDQALIANEAIEDCQSRKRYGFMFKIDFEKVYDYVDWDFLDRVLTNKGFGYRWRLWIWSCIWMVRFSIFMDGKPQGRIKATRLVRYSKTR